jgi:hypothetical protein
MTFFTIAAHSRQAIVNQFVDHLDDAMTRLALCRECPELANCGTALATATAHSQRSRKEWSFWASPKAQFHPVYRRPQSCRRSP